MFAASKSGSPAVAANYIEDVFSTYLYTGNGSTQTITNGIDLAGKGGMLWTKERSAATYGHRITDTARGSDYWLATNDTVGQQGPLTNYTAFNSNGFTLDSSANHNTNATTYASWTFRKQAKFFDVVTYTGDGTNDRAINHNLGSAPGCIIVKRTDTTSAWSVYHRSLPAGTYNRNLYLNTTASYDTNVGIWGTSDPTSTQFRVGTAGNLVNVNGATYVAYLFAHDAGGFGASGTDNVISCGSFTTDGSGNATVNLGYEPQWLLVKVSSTTGSWRLLDNMRGIPTGGNDAVLFANLSAAEDSGSDVADLSATGFSVKGLNASATVIYIAIRRGPMRTPTSGSSVFAPVARTGTGAAATTTAAGFVVDSMLIKQRDGTNIHNRYDRLRGPNYFLDSASTTAETSYGGTTGVTAFDKMTGVALGTNDSTNLSGGTFIDYYFRRAPGFFDVVCYTGTGSSTAFNHNLTVVPEFFVTKSRSNTGPWYVYHKDLGVNNYLVLNTTAASAASTNWTAVTSTTFTISLLYDQVAYLFATLSGVSKVGSYTGTGALQTIDCGFAAGARFVLIKRTDSTGDWYVYDSARGITSGNDPYLFLNSTAAEVTSTNYVDTASTGFQVTAAAPAGLNANGGTYIFLAIA